MGSRCRQRAPCCVTHTMCLEQVWFEDLVVVALSHPRYPSALKTGRGLHRLRSSSIRQVPRTLPSPRPMTRNTPLGALSATRHGRPSARPVRGPVMGPLPWFHHSWLQISQSNRNAPVPTFEKSRPARQRRKHMQPCSVFWLARNPSPPRSQMPWSSHAPWHRARYRVPLGLIRKLSLNLSRRSTPVT